MIKALWRLPQTLGQVARPDSIAAVHQAWEMGGRVISIEGMGGVGKSSVLRQFLESHAQTLPDGLVWSFYHSVDVEEFLDALHQALAGKPSKATGWGRAEAVLDLLQGRAYLLALDGLERIQSDVGRMENDMLESLLLRAPGTVRTLVTTCLPLTGLDSTQSLSLEGLTPAQSLELLHGWMDHGSEAEKLQMATVCRGHPLLLRISARASLLGVSVAEGVPLDALLGRIMEFYRNRLAPESQELLKVVCVGREPVSTEALTAILTRDETWVLEKARGLAHLGLLESHGRGQWLAHPLVAASFLREPDYVTAHGAIASFLSSRATDVSERSLPVYEDWIYHLCRSGHQLKAYRLYRTDLGGVLKLCLEKAECVRCERILRILLDAFERLRAEATGWAEELAVLHNDYGVTLDQLGALRQASVHYRMALRYRRSMGHGGRGVLYNYVDNLLMRGLLPLAERLALRIRSEVVARDKADREPEAWINVWYLRCLRGQPTIDLPAVLPTPPIGTATLCLADILLRRGEALRAMHLLELTHETVRADDLKLQSLVGGVRAWSLDRTLLDNLDVPARVNDLILQARHRGLRWLQVQMMMLAGQLEADPERGRQHYAEALAMSIAQSFKLIELDIRILIAEGDSAVLEALRARCVHPRVDYAWGALQVDRQVAPWTAEASFARLQSSTVVAARPADDERWPQSLDVPWMGSARTLPGYVRVPWKGSLPPLVVLFSTRTAPSPLLYRNALAESIDRSNANLADRTTFYDLTALVVVGGYSPARMKWLEARLHVPWMDSLLLLNLQVAAQPRHEHVALLSSLLAKSQAPVMIRAAGWWNLGALCQSQGRWKEAHKAFEACHRLNAFAFVRAHLERLEESAEDQCEVDLALLVGSLTHWRRLHPQMGYPASMNDIVPRWWSSVPTCRGTPVFYRTNQHGTRFVVACRPHHRAIDSTLGMLGKARTGDFPPPLGFGKLEDLEFLLPRAKSFTE